MNYADIQIDVLKAAYAKKTKNKTFPYRYGIVSDCICVTDTHKLVKIPQDICFLHLETVFSNMPMNLRIICDDSKATAASDTQVTKSLTINNKRLLIHIFKVNNSNEEIWIDARLLKGFDLKNSMFKAINRKNPLYIYEDGVMVGLILPVNHN